MKILFLDFDGVLNLQPKHSSNEQFHKPACINLEYLLNKEKELKVVISSAWRKYGIEYCKQILQKNGIDPRRVIDVTGEEKGADKDNERGYQVESWLSKHPKVKQFAIIDDQSDFTNLRDHLVKVAPHIGLTQANVEKALEILGK